MVKVNEIKTFQLDAEGIKIERLDGIQITIRPEDILKTLNPNLSNSNL